MLTISFSDTVLASATYQGRTVATLRSSGFNSINEVMLALRRAATGITGFINLSVRNASRGGREERSLFIMPAGL